MAKYATVLQMNIIRLWADGKSVKEITEELNCSAPTVHKVKSNPEYRQMFYERQAAQIEELVPLAVKRLVTIINDDSQQGSVHIAAIREILDRSHLAELAGVIDKNIKISVTYE